MIIFLIVFLFLISGCAINNFTSISPSFTLNIYEVVYDEDKEVCTEIFGDETCYTPSTLELRYSKTYKEGTEIDLEKLKSEIYIDYVSKEETPEFDGFYLKNGESSEKLELQYYCIYNDLDFTYEIKDHN